MAATAQQQQERPAEGEGEGYEPSTARRAVEEGNPAMALPEASSPMAAGRAGRTSRHDATRCAALTVRLCVRH